MKAKLPIPANPALYALVRDKKAKIFLDNVGTGLTATEAGRVAKYTAATLQNAKRDILYPVLRKYGWHAMKRLERAGMGKSEALRLFAKAIGHPLPPTDGEVQQALRDRGFDADKLAELVVKYAEAMRTKTYRDPKSGEPIEREYPDNMMRAKMLEMAARLMDVFPAQKLEQKLDIKGRLGVGVVTVPLGRIARLDDEYHPRYGMAPFIDVEPEPTTTK